MNNKYEFVAGDEKVITPGRTVKRIRALAAIAVFGVMPGQLGGYVESEKCLAADGDAWVSGDARVYGNAQVSGNAWVYGNAWVSGDARVYGDAWVYGNAQVSGDARVSGDAQVYGNAWVYGDAWVSGDAWVYGNAWVYGDARVYGNARVSGDALVSGDAQVSGNASLVWFSKVGRDNGTLTVFTGKDGELLATRGCFIGTIDEFLKKSEEVHDDRTHLEYRLLIEVAHSRLTRSAT